MSLLLATPGLMRLPPAGGGGLVVTREGTGDDFFTASDSFSTTRTFSAVDIGAAAAGRRIYVGYGAVENNTTIPTVTIDGVPMNLIDSGRIAFAKSSLYYLDSDTIGGLVDIIATTTNTLEAACQVWSSVGHTSFVSDVSIADSTTVVGTIDTSAGGALIGVCMVTNSQNNSWNQGTEFINDDIRSDDFFIAFEDLSTSAAVNDTYSVSSTTTTERSLSLLAIS